MPSRREPEPPRQAYPGGFELRVGPFVYHIRTDLSDVADYLSCAYSDYAKNLDGVVDYEAAVLRRRSLKHLLRREVVFHGNGHLPYHPFPPKLAVPLLEWGMNWLVYSHAHQFLILHAAVVAKNGRALVLCGASGTGKSTLTALLVSRGWRLLSDELTLIRPGDVQITPFPKPISLKGSAISVVEQHAGRLKLVGRYDGSPKGRLALVRTPCDSVQASQETAVARWLVFPRYNPAAELELSRVPRSRALLRVAENAFNYQLQGRPGFETLCDVLGYCRCLQLDFSDAVAAIERLEDELRIGKGCSDADGPPIDSVELATAT